MRSFVPPWKPGTSIGASRPDTRTPSGLGEGVNGGANRNSGVGVVRTPSFRQSQNERNGSTLDPQEFPSLFLTFPERPLSCLLFVMVMDYTRQESTIDRTWFGTEKFLSLSTRSHLLKSLKDGTSDQNGTVTGPHPRVLWEPEESTPPRSTYDGPRLPP